MKSLISAYVEYNTALYVEEEAKKRGTNKSRIIEEAIKLHKEKTEANQ